MSAFKYKKTSRTKIFIKVLIGFFVIVGVAAGVLFFWFRHNIQPVDSTGEAMYRLTIETGATEAAISKELEEQGVIRSSLAYQIQARLSGKSGTMRAGEYEVKSNQSVRELLEQFAKGDVSVELVTILPAQRIYQIEEYFLSLGYSEAEVRTALDPGTYRGHPALADKPADANLEGYLYPESFLISAQTPLASIVESSLDEMALLLTPGRKLGFEAQGLTTHEAIIVASIIENEVTNLEDKALVAQVFLKRLREGISLGADPTAFYGSSLLGVEDSVFVDSPYNTRIYTGLPPGPISNVSAASLDAVINPSKTTDYLYFVAGDDGVTHFSKTLEQHTLNTSLYCTILCQ